MFFFSQSQKVKIRSHIHFCIHAFLKNCQFFKKNTQKKHHFIPQNTVWFFWENIFSKKRAFYFASIFLVLGFFSPEITTAQMIWERKTFIATAYYSPLPFQQKYYTGDFESEKRLNGEGIAGSDGTPVFLGMIAAPKNYPFGTKIALDGLGVVSVHDRGGAINASENGADRIDIWMGFGDEWLSRTLSWGRREIIGTFVEKNTPTNITIPSENLPPSHIEAAKNRLNALGFDATNNFSAAVLDFQQKYQIITTSEDPGAGIYGPKTTAKLLQVYQEKFSPVTKNFPQKEKSLENIVEYSYHHNANNADLVYQMETRSIGESSSGITQLQIFLQKEGFYEESISGKMTLAVLKALRHYQHAKKIIPTGRVDLVTKLKIREDLVK